MEPFEKLALKAISGASNRVGSVKRALLTWPIPIDWNSIRLKYVIACNLLLHSYGIYYYILGPVWFGLIFFSPGWKLNILKSILKRNQTGTKDYECMVSEVKYVTEDCTVSRLKKLLNVLLVLPIFST